MNESKVQLQPAYILHYKKYRETSLLLDVLTRDYGKITLLAKGVRKTTSRTVSLLQPFVPLDISCAGNRELKILTHVESSRPIKRLSGMPLYCGFYLNELIQYFLPAYEPYPEIYSDYQQSLFDLADAKAVEKVLRMFEYNLLENTGYGLQLFEDRRHGRVILADEYYRYDVESGPVQQNDGPYSGKTLIALRDRNFQDRQVCKEAKRLLRAVIAYHLAGKTFKSRIFLTQLKNINNPNNV